MQSTSTGFARFLRLAGCLLPHVLATSLFAQCPSLDPASYPAFDFAETAVSCSSDIVFKGFPRVNSMPADSLPAYTYTDNVAYPLEYFWFASQSGGAPLNSVSEPVFSYAPASHTGSLWLEIRVSLPYGSCYNVSAPNNTVIAAARLERKYVRDASLVLPAFSLNPIASNCGGQDIVFSLPPSHLLPSPTTLARYTLFTDAAGTAPLAGADNLSPGRVVLPAATPSRTYYVARVAGSCQSYRKKLFITKPLELPVLDQPLTGDDRIHVTNVDSLPSTLYEWFSSSTAGGEPLQTTTAYEPPDGSPVYVRARNLVTGCTSAMATFTPDAELINNHNYIISNVANVHDLKTGLDLNAASIGDKSQSVAYFDGLGDQEEVVQTGITPSGHDLISYQTYDALRRPYQQYLPTPTTKGSLGFYLDASSFGNASQDYYGSAITSDGGSATDSRPWSETLYEDSPLGREKQQIGPGEEWQQNSRTVDKDYSLLATGLEVPYFVYDYDTKTATQQGFYAAGSLSITRMSDEDGIESYQYTDAFGRAILSMHGTFPSESSAVYSIYDSKGQLRFVLSPKTYDKVTQSPPAPGSPGYSITYTSADVADYDYAYSYDAKGRVIEKYVPGAGKTSYVYDAADRLIGEQNALLASQSPLPIWQYYKYDYLGRKIQEGYAYIANSRQVLQALADHDTPDRYWEDQTPGMAEYSNLCSPFNLASNKVNIWYFYDTYPKIKGNSYVRGFEYISSINGHLMPEVEHEGRTNGKLTLKLVRTTETGPTTGSEQPARQLLATAYFYNSYGRVVQEQSDNIDSLPRAGAEPDRFDVTTTVYASKEFSDKPEQIDVYHASRAFPGGYNYQENFEYDQAWRIIKISHGDKTIAEYDYTETGKPFHKNFGAQQVDYSYNIRGWLTSINNPFYLSSDLFAERLHYTPGTEGEDLGLSTGGYYNGKPKSMAWTDAGSDLIHGYDYDYDGLDRLSYAHYGGMDYPKESSFTMSGHYDESAAYDPSGNIISLARSGVTSYNGPGMPGSYGPLDALTYHYAGNKVTAIDNALSNLTTDSDPQLRHFRDWGNTYSSATPEYTYGPGGWLTGDVNNTHLTYSYHPSGGLVGSTAANPAGIFTEYAAVRSLEGQRLKETYTPVGPSQPGTPRISRTCGRFLYEAGENPYPRYDHAEGFVQLEMYTPPYGSPYLTQHYYYYLRDHLGSIRAVFDEQLDEGHGQPWFPPGGPINGRTSASSARSSLRSSQTATMELAAAWVEDTLYPGVAQARSYSPDEAYGGNYVARLGGALRWGPGRSLPVSRGDSVHAQVFALAEQEASATLRRAAPRIGLFFTGVAGLFGSGERRAARPGPGLGFVLPLSGGTPGRAARQGQGEGALNYAFYDRDSALVSYGRLPLEGGQADWQQLSLDLEAGQEGYVYVYLSGESGRYTLFDELSVAVYSRKVELKAYYPYGREIADLGYKSPSWRGDPFAFTGKPRLDWAGLPMQDFGARMYDSQTGRWNGADPLAENGMAWSPFAYCFDSPATHTDPDGRWAHDGRMRDDDLEKFIVATGSTTGTGGPGGDEYLVAKLAATAFFDAKHAIENMIMRVVGSDTRFDYKVKNGQQVFETVAYQGAASSNSLGKEAFDASLDALTILGAKAGGPAAGLASENGGGNQLTKAAKELNAIHGNSKLSTKPATLYELNDAKTGEYLKTGVTSASPIEKRYSSKFMQGKEMNPLQIGPRIEILQVERKIVMRNPGPLNKEPWAGSQQK